MVQADAELSISYHEYLLRPTADVIKINFVSVIGDMLLSTATWWWALSVERVSPDSSADVKVESL
jgi:hypothetical protein